jgi:hypothetical protein
MRHLTTGFRAGILAAIIGVLLALPASAAHIGNNKAELSGPEGVSGQSVANYSTGQDAIRANATVQGLEAGEDYTFRLRHNNGDTSEVCTFTARRNGSGGCSGEVDGVGFHHADILDDEGSTVATGTYERRGNCREASQGGSLCESDQRNPQ